MSLLRRIWIWNLFIMTFRNLSFRPRYGMRRMLEGNLSGRFSLVWLRNTSPKTSLKMAENCVWTQNFPYTKLTVYQLSYGRTISVNKTDTQFSFIWMLFMVPSGIFGPNRRMVRVKDASQGLIPTLCWCNRRKKTWKRLNQDGGLLHSNLEPLEYEAIWLTATRSSYVSLIL